ncbi:MAG: ABC transporter [Alphaproteobacteria bacterium]|nr:ABC transporter [Alphaproteobacteria bacterium]
MANSSFLSSLSGQRSRAVWAAVLAIVLFVSVNIIVRGTLVGARIDLTADKLFTLSPGTHKVLGQIDEPVTLRFYFSTVLGKELPALGKYATRVRDMLQEYAANSGGKIRLIEVDPVSFSDAEDEAVAAGLQGLPLDRTGEMVYFGLAGTNSTDESEVIAFFSPDREPFLEYDLTKVVYRLANPDRKIVGLMSWLPVRGFPGSMMARMSAMGQPWQMPTQLAQLFTVEDVSFEAAEIPANVDVLLIVHPAKPSPRALYAIDQFLMRGGRALVFVDPLAEVAQQVPGPGGKFVDTSSDLKPIFDQWGLEYDPGKVAGDMVAAFRINAGSESRPQPLEYPAWLRLDRSNVVGNDLITTELDNLVMATAGTLSMKAGTGMTFTPLVATSEQSMLLEAADLKGGRPDFESIVRNFKPSGKRLVLAARINGPSKSAFPKGPPEIEEYLKEDPEAKRKKQLEDDPMPVKQTDEEKKKEAEELRARLAKAHRTESAQPVHAVVVTDADMLQDRFWVQAQNLFGQTIAVPVSDNMNLTTNSIDNLTGSNELIGLRSRGVSRRPFTLVEDLTRKAELNLRAKERELQKQREETERKLSELQTPGRGQQGAGGEKTILSPAQVREINKFKAELLTIRKELRAVQLGLRKDIEVLEGRLWMFNIGMIPLLVALAAVGLGLARMRRRRQRMETEARG